jgi:aspartate carbamoyltransferase regulatory subunit
MNDLINFTTKQQTENKEELMESHFVVTNKNGIKVQCLYYGNHQDNAISGIQTLKYGDILTITDYGKYVFGIGWHILIIVNEKTNNFVPINILEDAINSNNIQLIIDLVTEHITLSYQLDKALECKNKELFLCISNKHRHLQNLMDKISFNTPAI